MFSFLKSNPDEDRFDTVVEGLKTLYKRKLFPLEEHYMFDKFHSPFLDEPDFEAKPMILLIGQYSTGKTSFIKYLLESDFPGIRIGPEPTTDRFIVVMTGEQEGVVPGNALVVDPKKQFKPLTKFGNNFLNRFQCSQMPNKVLDSLTIVDTPGILSGDKQRVDRGYEFSEVVEWFAERVDRIVLLFDAHKLDISDEFRRVIELLKNYEDKIRIVLNKADMVDSQQLMRVYGALMWSLGKVLGTPEVARVYIGSFWSEKLHFDTNRHLFELEEQDLFKDLQTLPRNATLRKLNDLIKRARLAKVHAFIISQLRKEMPSMFGKDSKKNALIKDLPRIYENISREYEISPGDFPKVEHMQEILANQDFKKFHSLQEKLVQNVDDMLATDIARLMQMIPQEKKVETMGPAVKGGAFESFNDNPFGIGANEGLDKGRFEEEWVVNEFKYEYDEMFESLNPVNGKINGSAAKAEMTKSKLPFNILGKIWKLSDVDKDGQLDSEEFALAKYLIKMRLEGHEIANTLPDHLIPPSKR